MSDRNDTRIQPDQPAQDLRHATREVRDAAAQAASTVASEARAAGRTLRDEGAAVLEGARDRAEEVAEQGVRQGAEQVGGLARAIHRAADELEGDSPELARTIHDAAGRVDGMARALRDRSPGDLLRGAEDFARRQPVAFFGVAAIAGFALARFARASASHPHTRHDTRHGADPAPHRGPYRDDYGTGPLVAAAPGDSAETAERPEGTATLVAAAPGESVTTPPHAPQRV
jgi:hypothetical protein